MARHAVNASEAEPGSPSLSPALLPIHALIEAERKEFIESANEIKKVGYFCSYTPPELLNAAGVRHARLFKAGAPNVVSQGERYTQSVFCDFSKSCIGAFDKEGGDPFYLAVDKVYNFHTCASMKRATEVIEQFVPSTLLNLPRLRNEASSRAYFAEEIRRFRDDLAELTGRPIPDDAVREQIAAYNKVRRLLKKISELRKRPDPPISGRDFLELARGYFYLPPEKLTAAYTKLYNKLRKAPDSGARPVRLMIAGSVMADGDRRLVELIEDEIGARIVVEDHCTGARPFLHTVREKGDPFQALADGYLDQAPCARMKPLSDCVTFSGELAKEYGVDAVVYVYLKFCACYGITRLEFSEHYQKAGLPVLELSSDYSHSDHGQLKTRVEAFVELLKENSDIPSRPAAARPATHV